MENIFQMHFFQGTILIHQDHYMPIRKSSRLLLLTITTGLADVPFLSYSSIFFFLNNMWLSRHHVGLASICSFLCQLIQPQAKGSGCLPLTAGASHIPLLRGFPTRVSWGLICFISGSFNSKPTLNSKREEGLC